MANALAISETDATGTVQTGVDRVAILLLAIGPDPAGLIMQEMEEDEIRSITIAITRLGDISEIVSQNVVADFVREMGSFGVVSGNEDAAEKFLSQFLPSDKVTTIMEEIRGPAGRNLWEKLGNVQEEILANYFRNEYPQTVAVVLSKIRADHAAKVLTHLPEEFAMDVVHRMIHMDAIQKEVTEKIEQTLRLEFMSNLAQTKRRDNHEVMAEIFNSFDRQTEARFMLRLEEREKDTASHVKALMFTFDDLVRIDGTGVQVLLRKIDTNLLVLALKGAKAPVRKMFFSNMSDRAATALRDDMDSTGPVRLKEVDQAQSEIVNAAKDLGARGEINISTGSDNDEMVS